MKFGAYLYGDPRRTASETRTLVRHGFSKIWFGELPTMGFGDPFMGMRDAAQASEDVEVGTAVTAAGVRPGATLVTQLGTINSSAPGRVSVGIGTGAFARRLLGLQSMKVADFRTQLEGLRLLLDGRTAHVGDRPIAFREPRGGVRLDPPIRVLVAAGGPRTAALAGEFGDGLLATGVYEPSELGALRGHAERGARGAGRDPDALTFCLEAGPLCVVRDGEDLRSPRVLAIVEPLLSAYFVFWAVLGLTPDQVPVEAADLYSGVLSEMASTKGADSADAYLDLTTGALLRRPENDHRLSPAVIEACTLTGHRSELRDRIVDMARAGVTDIAVFRGRSYQWSDEADLEDLSDLMETI